LELAELARDLATFSLAIDATRVAHKTFSPGIGPFGEAAAVRAALSWLRMRRAPGYARRAIKRTPED
jgi:hypothetical protein